MVNQWGRDGNLATSSKGSSAGPIILSVVMLAVGLGAGYGATRFLGSGSSSELAARDARIAELQQTLSELKFDSQNSDGNQKALEDKISGLEADLAAANDSKASLEAEIEALQKTLDEAGDTSSEVTRLRKSLKVSELQIIDLEKEIAAQQRSIDDLREGRASGDALASRNAELEKALADARARLKTIPVLEDQIATLKEQLSSRTEDADREAQRRIASLEKTITELEAKLRRAESGTDEAARLTQEIADLKRQVISLGDRFKERDREAKALEDQLARSRQDLKAQTDEIAALNAQIKKLRATNADLQAQIDRLDRPLVSPNDDTKNDEPKDNPVATGPREPDTVDSALSRMPGFSRLSDAKQARLRDGLERGGCVTDSLKLVYKQVPPLALISLMRDLDSDC
ncbi:MAG: hypothetical protein RLZZ444_2127 [Pseudomonadota bacterium]